MRLIDADMLKAAEGKATTARTAEQGWWKNE